MHDLSTGVLDRIMNGEEVDRPVFQILGHKKLASNTSGERYRLLLSDGIKSNSFTMLATQLNDMITQNQLSEFSIVRINRYALSMVNNGGSQRRVMVILDVEVLTPGDQVGKTLGSVKLENGRPEESVPPAVAQNPPSEVRNRPAPPVAQPPPSRAPPAQKQMNNLNDSVSNGDVHVTPIAALSPYQNRWTIKVRVTNKSAIRTWSNSRGEGKLFSMDLVDESGEIRCTGFREAVDKFYDMIEIGGVYYMSKCQLKPANKTFNHLKNDYEMTIGNDTEIVACHEEASDIPSLEFNFVPISSIESRSKDELIDVLGIVRSASDVQTLITKATNKELKKRDVVIVDDSNASVTLTMWGNQAEEFDSSNNPVVAVKGGKIGEFQGSKNISLLVSSVFQKNPDLPQVHKLIGWYKNIGQDQDFKSISKMSGAGGNMNGPWLTLKEAQEKTSGQSQTVNNYITKATVNLIRTQNALYKSCPTQGCKKKVVDLSNGMYRCEKCNQEFPNFTYRLLLSCNLVDWTENVWATAFSDQGEAILHMTADELGLLHEQDENSYNEKIGEATFQSFIFKIQVRQENYNDELRLKSTIAAVQPINYKTYNEHLLTKIKELAGITKV